MKVVNELIEYGQLVLMLATLFPRVKRFPWERPTLGNFSRDLFAHISCRQGGTRAIIYISTRALLQQSMGETESSNRVGNNELPSFPNS